MKFSVSVNIVAPVNQVVGLFRNMDNFNKWQDGLLSFEHLSGTPGEPGSKSMFIYQSGRIEFELVETVSINNLPAEFTALYEAIAMTNTMSNRFISVSDNETRYEADVDYIKFNGLIPSLMGKFMPGMFRKQVQKRLRKFKVFVENETNNQS